MQTPGPLELRVETPVEAERRLDVGRGLHVDEQVPLELRRPRGQPSEPLERPVGAELEAEVRRLHGDLGVQPRPSSRSNRRR